MSENEILRLGQQDLKQVIKNSDKSLIFTFPENKNNNLPGLHSTSNHID